MARKHPPTIEQAIKTAALLGNGRPPTIKEVEAVSAYMGNWLAVNAHMATLPVEESSLRTLRAMLAHELARDMLARDMIVNRIAARHEQMSRQMRFAAMEQMLPRFTGGLRKAA